MHLVRRPATISGIPDSGELHAAARSGLRLAAAVALAGASLPAALPAAGFPGPRYATVALTAAPDITWDEVFQTAQASATDIAEHFSAAPFPALQQALANQIGYLQGLLNGSLTFDDVSTDIHNHLNAVFGAPATDTTTALPGALFGPFLPAGGATDTLYQSLDTVVNSTGTDLFSIITVNHDQLFTLVDGALPTLVTALGLDQSALPLVQSLIEFAASPLSGIVIGQIGTLLSPILQFNDDVTAIAAALSGATADWDTAFHDMADMPANITNALLHGYGDVDLMPILTQLGVTLPALELIPGVSTTVTGLTVDLGGLLSGAGSLFDSLGLGADGGDLGSLDLSGVAVGPLASMVELGQALAEALGWDGTGAPLDILTNLF